MGCPFGAGDCGFGEAVEPGLHVNPVKFDGINIGMGYGVGSPILPFLSLSASLKALSVMPRRDDLACMGKDLTPCVRWER